jgi:hypothetical protein
VVLLTHVELILLILKVELVVDPLVLLEVFLL